MRSLLALSAAFTLLLGCASHPPERATTASTQTSSSGGQATSHVRTELGCTDVEPTGEAACVARGCQWSAPLYCSGIQRPDDEIARMTSPTRPCTCVCEEERVRCMEVP